MADIPYFETSWSVLSTICLFCALCTLALMGMYGRNKMLLVPLVVSTAGAIADGLCYYGYYALEYPLAKRRAAAGIADIAWLIQELGLPFYSFQILRSLLTDRRRLVYLSTFLSFCAAAVLARVGILIFRQMMFSGKDVQKTVNALHMVYFLSIACAECVNAFFLVRKLSITMDVAQAQTIRQTLIASSEVRMASLSVVGIARTVTYYYQSDAQAATNVASELDRFVATMEVFFPVIMLFDFVLTRTTARSASSSGRSAGVHTTTSPAANAAGSTAVPRTQNGHHAASRSISGK